MLPPKKGKDKDSQQIVSLGIYCNAPGIQSAEKQAQKLASQLTLKEFRWDEWGSSQSKNRDRSGYWIDTAVFSLIKDSSNSEKTSFADGWDSLNSSLS